MINTESMKDFTYEEIGAGDPQVRTWQDVKNYYEYMDGTGIFRNEDGTFSAVLLMSTREGDIEKQGYPGGFGGTMTRRNSAIECIEKTVVGTDTRIPLFLNKDSGWSFILGDREQVPSGHFKNITVSMENGRKTVRADLDLSEDVEVSDFNSIYELGIGHYHESNIVDSVSLFFADKRYDSLTFALKSNRVHVPAQVQLGQLKSPVTFVSKACQGKSLTALASALTAIAKQDKKRLLVYIGQDGIPAKGACLIQSLIQNHDQLKVFAIRAVCDETYSDTSAIIETALNAAEAKGYNVTKQDIALVVDDPDTSMILDSDLFLQYETINIPIKDEGELIQKLLREKFYSTIVHTRMNEGNFAYDLIQVK